MNSRTPGTQLLIVVHADSGLILDLTLSVLKMQGVCEIFQTSPRDTIGQSLQKAAICEDLHERAKASQGLAGKRILVKPHNVFYHFV